MQRQPSPDETRNLILAAVLSFAVIGLWQVFVVGPQLEEQAALQEQLQASAPLTAPQAQSPFAEPTVRRSEPRDAATRIPLENDHVSGSISRFGGRLDVLYLKDFREELDADSPPVEWLFPIDDVQGQHVFFGWDGVEQSSVAATPDLSTQWLPEQGASAQLTPETPITLRWNNGEGLIFRRQYQIDEYYLLTVTQSVENTTSETVKLRPYGVIDRRAPQSPYFWISFEGGLRLLNGELTRLGYDDYQDLPQSGPKTRTETVYSETGGWVGFVDKYWMTTLVPMKGQSFSAEALFEIGSSDEQLYRNKLSMDAVEVQPGATQSNTMRVFIGAKEIELIREYQYLFDEQERPTGVFGKISDFFFYTSESRFVDTIDWGWFFFLTKPLFEILMGIQDIVGNMGVAIILLTVVVKTLLFPLALKSYVSMSRMKALQPEMKKIQERAGEDKMQMQREMMELYKKEKVNPAAGCLPILLQIPIFFSLYKVLFVTLEIRHAPFFGWVQDLSAPDPTSIFNLFGLLPYDVPAILLIGIWPVLMGITMWLQQMLNPAPTDPVQEKIFNFLPLIFTFLLGTFSAGLVIYWTANNLLTIIQQYSIMRSQGVNPDILGNIKRQLGLAPKETPS